MKKSNWGWGALRISQELALLGISVHKKTVSKILKEFGILPPKTKVVPPNWESLIRSYSKIWAMDFLSCFDWLGNQVFVLVIIDQSSRELIWMSATYSPNRYWLSQQFRNIAVEEVDFPHALILDNDPVYGKWLKPFLLDQFEVKILKIPPRSPWCNGVCERVNKTIQVELLDRISVTTAVEVLPFLRKYKGYYNDVRPHQGLTGRTPTGGKVIPLERLNINELKYNKSTHIDGLFTEFSLSA